MRSGYSTRCPNLANDLTTLHRGADRNGNVTQVQKAGKKTMAVVDDDGASGIIKIGIGQTDNAICRGCHGCACGYCDVQSVMGASRLAVIVSLTAVNSADAAFYRPAKTIKQITLISIQHPGLTHLFGLSANTRQHFFIRRYILSVDTRQSLNIVLSGFKGEINRL